jgi:Domain of unknown function (DUF4340)
MMNSKNTFVWFVLAAGLFASILLLDRYQRPPVVSTIDILPGLQPASVTSVQVIPAGSLEIRADHAGGSWLLARPISYPAQSAAVEELLDALQHLVAATRITAGEIHEHHSSTAGFGFDPPQVSVAITAGDQRWQLQVGNMTAPGDQVFLRVVGVDGVFVADAAWLKLIPRSANDWRSTALVATEAGNCDTIILTNGAKIIELRRDATNQLWRMMRPLPVRADSDRITDALQRLQAAQAAQFVPDEPKPDLVGFGLQPATLDLWLNYGTNFISALHIGKIAANDAALVYARRERWNVVFTTAIEPLSPWRGTWIDFRDPHLLELTGPVAEIEVHGPHGFTLQQQGTNGWKIVGEKFPVDADNVQLFIKTLAGLRVAEFIKDVVTAPDLVACGLALPARQIILRSAIGDSNAVIAQLAFAVQTNRVFVHRADEDSIYAIAPEDLNRLPEAGWEFRERHIWHFNEKDVAQVTLHKNGKIRQLVHDGPNKWSLAPGSQGIINPPAVEETVHRLGDLTVVDWLARNVTEPEKIGLAPDNLEMVVELKNGEKFSVAFGTELPSANTALAVVTLDGERWAFVFPPVLYQFVTSWLNIPANSP